MKSFLTLSVVVVGLGLGLVACNPTDAKELTQDAGQLAESGTRSLVNASLAVKVNTALGLRKGVDMTGLRVESEGGTITVSGHVRTAKEKALVLEIARETKGVEKVVDKLTIKP
ncbi:MAG: BON domain-containing protein [Fimbriimonadaceae bacterium]|jgi:osmotically-inducible protein OsmY|nr:BON domain-containing protein [Fimbriimonadaceae bacterium]